MSKTDQLTKLGAQGTQYADNNPHAGMFDLFQNTAGRILIPFVCNEFTSLCPKTGQPDFARVEVLYVPTETCIESKSLKLYLFAYRNHGDFHEDCTNKICMDIVKRINPAYIRVWGDFNVRGGISIKPMKEYWRQNVESDEREHIRCLVEQYDRLRHWDYQ